MSLIRMHDREPVACTNDSVMFMPFRREQVMRDNGRDCLQVNRVNRQWKVENVGDGVNVV